MKSRYMDVKNILKVYKDIFKTESQLRFYIFNAETNGMKKCISRLGKKKLIIDIEEFEKWLKKGF